MNIGQALKKIRKSRKMKALDVARISGITCNTISLSENSARPPRHTTMESLAKVYNIPVGMIYLMGIELEDIPSDKLELWQEFEKLREKMLEG